MRFGNILHILVTGLLVHLVSGCSSPERQTPAEWIRDNTRILTQLGSYQQEERQEGINRFLALGEEQGSEVVFYLLNDQAVENDERIVVILARILSIWKDTRGIPYLLDRLSSQDRGVIRIATEGLMAYGDDRRIRRDLEEKLGDPNLETRRAAATVLSRMRHPHALTLLGGRLRSEKDMEVRALCLLGVADAEPSRERTGYLIDALTDTEPHIRQHAWHVLSREKGVPKIYDPFADLAGRAQAIADLRRWAGIPRG